VHRATPALALKHGFDSIEEYREKAQKKFSLVENGIVDMPSTRLLLVNVRGFRRHPPFSFLPCVVHMKLNSRIGVCHKGNVRRPNANRRFTIDVSVRVAERRKVSFYFLLSLTRAESSSMCFFASPR
jgi:hypothetical protein